MLPDRGTKASAVLGIASLAVPVPLEGSRRLARPIERLLGGIPAVGVQDGAARLVVLPAVGRLFGEPDTLLAEGAPMVGKRRVVVPGAFLIQFIGQGFTAPVGKGLRGDHSLDCAAMYFWMVSLLTLSAVLAK